MRAHPVSISEGGSEIMGSNPSVQGHRLNLTGAWISHETLRAHVHRLCLPQGLGCTYQAATPSSCALVHALEMLHIRCIGACCWDAAHSRLAFGQASSCCHGGFPACAHSVHPGSFHLLITLWGG